MSRYVALLRGINVGGRVILPMARLRTLFAVLGFTDVVTVLQSGNVLFDAPSRNADLLRRRIELSLAELTGLEVLVLLRTVHELKALVRSDPFADMALDAEATKYVTFLAGKSAAKLALPLSSPRGEVEILRINRLTVLSVGRPRAGRPGFPNAFIEATLGVSATTRAWTTLSRIVDERTGTTDAGGA